MKTSDQQPELIADHYRLAGLLGRGAMADVYRAVDERSGATVAIKLIQAEDVNVAQRLAREASALRRLDHPGLVRFLDTGIHHRHAYLVMELVDGVTLAHVLRRGPISTKDTAHLGAELGYALAYVHSQRVVHRDVKPSNILLTADGGVKLADFGIARLLDASTVTLAGTTLGTAAYMAPEQLEDHQVGTSADIWSLGLVLLECMTGRRVFEGAPAEIVARRLAGPVLVPGDLPAPWRLVLGGMLDPRPTQRLTGTEVADFLTTSAFAEPWVPSPGAPTEVLDTTAPHDLAALTPGHGATRQLDPVPAGAVFRTPRPRRARGHRWWLAVVGALAGAGIAAGLALAFASTTPPHRGRPSVGASIQRTTTTPPTATTTTTTSPPSAPPALATLQGDLSSAVQAGSISAGVAQSIANPAEQAVSDAAAGMANQAANDFQHAARTIATLVTAGSISGAEGSKLQADLSALGDDLGLGAAAAPPTTTPATSTGTKPGRGHHHDQ